jgi:hypothetical protein
VIDPEVRTGQLVALPIDSPLLYRNVTAFHRVASPPSRAAREVMTEIERAFQRWERTDMPRTMGRMLR